MAVIWPGFKIIGLLIHYRPLIIMLERLSRREEVITIMRETSEIFGQIIRPQFHDLKYKLPYLIALVNKRTLLTPPNTSTSPPHQPRLPLCVPEQHLMIACARPWCTFRFHKLKNNSCPPPIAYVDCIPHASICCARITKSSTSRLLTIRSPGLMESPMINK